MDQATQDRLEKIFGEDVTFDRVERKLYSHDVGSVPRLVQPFMPGGLAGAVVRPRDEASLVQLVDLATRDRPEARPPRRGDRGLRGQRSRARARSWSTCAAGSASSPSTRRLRPSPSRRACVWKDLEPVLAEHDLALRLYPDQRSRPRRWPDGWRRAARATAATSMVGSATTSSRRGSYCPRGEVAAGSGTDLDIIADAEGMTGLHHPGDPAGAAARRRQPVRRVLRRREGARRRAWPHLGRRRSRSGR